MHITEAATKLRPGTAWNLRGDVLEQAEDDAPRVSVPSLAELQALINADAYKELRAKEYPPIQDQLDAIWKGGDALLEMAAKIKAVKDKYPK